MNAGDLLWQSTLLLGLGALASLAHRGRPARGHHALLLAAAMTLALPALALGVGALGWGLLPAPDAAPSSTPPVRFSADELVPPPLLPPAPALTAPAPSPTSSGADGAGAPASVATSDTHAAAPSASPPLPWRRIALLSWAGLSLLAALRLAQSWRQARRLVALSRPATDPALRVALERAAESVGLARQPRLAGSQAVTSPLLWPWAGDGVVLVPPDAAAQRGVDWGAVFAHELAHLRRRDHRGLLLSNLLVVLLPWQPLAWWCRRQIARLADLACDDWVLASGHPRADYAGALLAFVPATSRAWAQAAVSNGGTLRGRVRRILESGRAAPLIGRGWSWTAGALALLVALALACAQPGEPPHELAVRDHATTGDSGASVDGVVLDASGQARVGVTVLAVLSGEKGDELRRTTTTDNAGRFRFEALAGDRWWSFSADDPDFARQWIGEVRRELPEDTSTAVELVLQPPQKVSGTVRNAEGQPVRGARVTLIRESPDDPKQPLQGTNNLDLAVTTTDAEGRFTLDRLRSGWVSLMLDHPDYARTFTGGSQLKAGQQDAELVIERGYTLRGRVTVDGKPLPGVAIDVGTPHVSDRAIGEWSVRTDELGRFELLGVSTLLSRASSSSGWPLVTLSVDDPHWGSPHYRVFDEGKPELPEVELQAVPRDAADALSEVPEIDVNKPTNGTVERLAGRPAGTTTLRVVLDVAARTRDGNLRQVWLMGPANRGLAGPRQEPVDESGVVVFDQLAAGAYNLWVPPTEPPTVPRLDLSLGDGESREVTLRPGAGRVHGRITCGGAAVTGGGIDVNIWQSESMVGVLQSAGQVYPDGTWEASGLPFGRYRLTFDHGDGGHSVPNYFVVELSQPETRLDLELPQTRIDFTLRGREYKPADFDELSEWDMATKYSIRVYPGGTTPMGGNTAGIIQVVDGLPFVEHLPPGRWTLKTTSSDGRELVARVALPTEASRATAELVPTDNGTGAFEGQLIGLDPTRVADVKVPVRFEAYPKDPEGLDVTASYGSLTVEGDRYRLAGLPPGRYGILVGPSYELEELRQDEAIVPHVYLPDVVVGEGGTATRDIALPPVRNVLIETRNDAGDAAYGSWRIDLGGGDWLPFHIFVGSEPRGLVAIPSAFPLPIGDHRLEVTFRGEAPQVRRITVEPGEGVQEIEIAR